MSKRQKVGRGAVSDILRGSQQAIKPAKRHKASKPATAKMSERKKCTFQLDTYDVGLLEDEKYQRRTEGKSADLSGLVREAIRLAYGSGKRGSFDEAADAFNEGMKRDKKRGAK